MYAYSTVGKTSLQDFFRSVIRLRCSHWFSASGEGGGVSSFCVFLGGGWWSGCGRGKQKSGEERKESA